MNTVLTVWRAQTAHRPKEWNETVIMTQKKYSVGSIDPTNGVALTLLNRDAPNFVINFPNRPFFGPSFPRGPKSK